MVDRRLASRDKLEKRNRCEKENERKKRATKYASVLGDVESNKGVLRGVRSWAICDACAVSERETATLVVSVGGNIKLFCATDCFFFFFYDICA